MHNTGEIMQLCRLCLVKEQVNVPIFEGQGDVRQIFQKISSCLPVKINRSDKLPKNICDGCSEKLDLFYDFWNTSVNSEKQLLEWLGQTPLSAGAGTTIAAKNSTTKPTDPVQQIKVDVKQEPSDHTDNNESFQAEAAAMADDDEFKEESAPPPKRARRAVTKRKPITVAPDSDDDDDDDYEPVEPLTKLEDESGNSDNDNDNDNEDDSFAAPSTSADDQPGPSGLGKDGVEAPKTKRNGKRKLKSRTCDFCGKEFKNRRLRNAHMKRHSILRPFKCEICDKSFKRNYELASHKICHSNDTTAFSFQCEICSKIFKRKGSYVVHKKRHLQDYCAKCELCNVGFVTNQEYRNHMGSKHGDSAYSHICDICGRSLCDKNSLFQHMATHDVNYGIIKPFVCKTCGRNFTTERNLKRHFQRNHVDHPSYVCDICGKELSTKQYLKEHKRIHEGFKPNKCFYCEKSFVRKDTLNLHMRTHTGQRPHICSICGKGFTQLTPLKVHMRGHTGEKPYHCSLCDMKFSANSLLSAHIKSNHHEPELL